MWTRRWIALPTAVLMLTLVGGADGIDKGELECEEAVAHLIHCCPNDAPARNVACFVGRDCDKTVADLTPAQSRCLRDESCDALYASGACEAPKAACRP
jgi:hypothetical protein